MAEIERIGGTTRGLAVSQCVVCDHKHAGSNTCDAYPDDQFLTGIPEDILTNKHDHREDFEADNGIHYESEVKWNFKAM